MNLSEIKKQNKEQMLQNMDLLIFKIFAFLTLLIFTFYISDFRNKKGMIPIINKKLTFFLKIFYFVPIFIYLYVIINLKDIFIHTYLGLFFTFLGLYLVSKAKIDLGKYHTWAGHLLHSTKMITEGIYAFIRHPLYTGIFTFITGAIILSIDNNPFTFLSTTIIIIFVFLIVIFLVISALREDKFLEKKFGDNFNKYKKRVHPCFPVRKFVFEE